MHPPRRRNKSVAMQALIFLHSISWTSSSQDISSLPTAAQEQIRRQIEERQKQRNAGKLPNQTQNQRIVRASASTSTWGETIIDLAWKWSNDEASIQKYRDFETVLKLHEIDDYMTKVIHKANDNFYEPVYDKCVMRNEYCAEIATKGLCLDATAVSYMLGKCAPACKTCHLLSYETRCPFDEDTVGDDAIGKGELNEVFEMMLINKDLQEKYGPMTIHSQPPDGPWIISFDHFLSEVECNKLIDFGITTGTGFSKSQVRQHEIDPTFNASSFRTSTTNWCRDECYNDPEVKRVHEKIEGLLSNVFPETNFEHMQLLKYETGQHYSVHSDFMPIHLKRPFGPRVLTLFLYLNQPELGGGTRFPDVGEGVTIQPTFGKIVIWPSVLNSDPLSIDNRTTHEALPVEKGRKFGANIWVHLRDFKSREADCLYEDQHAPEI